MKIWMRFTCAGIAVAAICGAFLVVQRGTAGDDPKVLMKKVDAIAQAIQKKKSDKATKLAAQLAENQEEVYYVMLLFKPRNRKGYGVGKAPGAIKPDGIEVFLREVSKGNVPANELKKHKEAMLKMAYRVSAVAEFAEHPPLLPRRTSGKKSKKAWLGFTKDMKTSTTAFTKAIQKGNMAAALKAGTKINASCNNCHSVFR